MLKVIAQDFIRPEFIAVVRPLYKELVEKSKAEPDCISYDLFEDQRQPGHFVFIETWPDKAALDRHCATEHFQRIVPKIDFYRDKDGEFMFLELAKI